MKKASYRIALFLCLLAACAPPTSRPGGSRPTPAVTPTPLSPSPLSPTSSLTASTFPTPLPSATPIPSAPPVPVATTIQAFSGLAIEIYPLKFPPQVEPLAFAPLQGTQAEIEQKHQALRDGEPLRRVEEANQALRTFDYRLESELPNGPYRLVKGAEPAFTQDIFDFSPVSVNAPGTDFLMEIMASDGNYLVQGKSITKGYGFPPPVFLGDQILSAEGSMAQDANNPQEMVVVMLDGREVFTTTAGIPSPVPFLIGLWSDSKHWTLEIARASGDAVHFQVDGEIFQDGRSLNQQYGYQATFEYQLLGGKPFYFYQKDGQIGISYAGQEIPLGFEEVSHYLCCSAGALNPRRYGPLIQFFARKGETWYYIEALAGDE